jgi:hypothetical protein
MMGCRARQRERERERERFGEGERETQRQKKMAWVDFGHWSKSTTPENFLRVSINNNNGRIRRQSNFGWRSTFLGYSWLNNINLNNTRSTTNDPS